MKNLIYFTINNNINYIELASLCINSLIKNNYDQDILFITNKSYEQVILKQINYLKSSIHFLILDDNFNNHLRSSANKLKIYQWPKIHQYNNIIYCDTDILWTDTPNKIFDQITSNHIYISKDNTDDNMSHKYWGGNILNTEEKIQINADSIVGLNAGLFAFNSNTIDHFDRLDSFFNSNIHLANECLEQPFINVYLYRNKIYKLFSADTISHNGYNISNKFMGAVLHFAGGPGNYTHKKNTMVNYFNNFLI